jgi:hypothetical protein
VLIRFEDLSKIDSLVDQMAKSRAASGGMSYRTAVLVLAAEHPEIFLARGRLRSKQTTEERVPYVFLGGSLEATDEALSVRRIYKPRTPVPDWQARGAMAEALKFFTDAKQPRVSDAKQQGALDAINTEIAKMQLESPGMNYADAWRSLTLKRPELIRAYNAEACRRAAE